MRWHEEGRTKDGKLRHPADALAWKAFDARYTDFASDPRSVRLSLASDGFNPFRTMTTSYSTWPVLLTPYNLPPWLCMKKQSVILSSIIPGEKGPGNDIDVYLQPLIKELKLLWAGVDAYDAFSKQHFKLRASLLWTVNDFPAYANLSGWSTKGRVACPICANSTRSTWLKHGRKFCYMGHRRWLEENHNYRLQKDRFDGTLEKEGPPTQLTGSDILKQVSGSRFKYGKLDNSSKKRTRDGACCSADTHLHTMDATNEESAFEDTENDIEEDIDGEHQLWKKKSVFFELPYWEYNLLRHNLDVMHIEKNVFDNVLGTLLNLDGKTKDNEKSRKDLMEMGIRHELHLKNHPNKKAYLPPACYTMTSVEKSNFLQILKNLKVPDGYASNISRGVSLKDRSFDMRELDKNEMTLKPKLGGTVHYQMVVSRGTSYVRNKAQPEGSIAEAYIKDECLTFCSRYFEGVETPFNRPPRNDESIVGKEMYMLNSSGRKLGKLEIIELDWKSLNQAHRYVLLNHRKIQPFRDHFLSEQQALKGRPLDSKIIEKLFVEEFPQWLHNQVSFLEKNKFDEEVLSLAIGPKVIAKYSFNGFSSLMGYRFLTKKREELKKTQNSGVIVAVEGGHYYGKLTNIIELDYYCGYKVVLFSV
ncbi:transposon, En/Spm-like protein [Tanacetum coccineum]